MTTHILADQMGASLEAWLTMEETLSTTQSLTDLDARYMRRRSIEEAIQAIEDTAARFRRRASRLSALPDKEMIQWAQAVLHFPNLAFLEVDTDGLHSDADLLRIVLMNRDGMPFYAQTVKPRRPLVEKIRHLTAIDPHELEDAPTLAQVWDDFRQALHGHYILSFNLPFDTGKLAENAERYHLPPVTIIGDCLMERAGHYFKQFNYPSLAALCVRIGHPLPDHPRQTAWDRARGQIALLTAMASGITDATSSSLVRQDTPDDPERTGELEDGTDEEHPF